MSDFFKKLNVLVKAGLNDLLDVDLGAAGPSISADRLGKNIDAEVTALRQRVNEALDYEDHLAARVQQLQGEVETLDRDADELLEQDREDEARHLLQRLHTAQQRLAMAEADLKDHRAVTRDLILRVNELDAAVADARQREPKTVTDDTMARAGQLVSDALQDMRERIAELGAITGTPDAPSETTTSEMPDEQAVDDDLAQRLDRLSKK